MDNVSWQVAAEARQINITSHVSFSIIFWAPMKPAHNSGGPSPPIPIPSAVTQDLLNIIANDSRLHGQFLLTSLLTQSL